MAVVINGNGTVTGIAVGGLPDGIVDNGTMADDAVAIADLAATGTASSTTFLRGDNSWQAAGGGAWNYLRSNTASGSSSLEFTADIDSTYDVYKIIYSDLEFSTDVTFKFRIGASGYDSGSSDYSFAFSGGIGNGTSDYYSTSANGIILTGAAYQDGTATGSAHMEVTLYTPSDTTHNKTIGVQFVGQSSNPGIAHHLVGAGLRISTAAYTRIQLTPHSGTITSGTARLYGISNS
jgi:hypothetical protein